MQKSNKSLESANGIWNMEGHFILFYYISIKLIFSIDPILGKDVNHSLAWIYSQSADEAIISLKDAML